MVDDIAIIRSMHTEAINHEPAITFFQTGFMIAGRPCIGSWLSYGLGSMNQNLPTFVVLQAKHNHPEGQRAGDLGAAVERRIPFRPVFRREPAQSRATRCCSSTIRTACPPKCAAACWMRWPR